MAKTMKAAFVDKFGEPLKIKEVPVPDPGPGQALVQIVASGVCHTDVHAADGDWPIKPTLPFIPGHEGAGYVAKLGSGVTHLKEGDRVGIAWLHSACGHCEFCLTGWETLCPEQNMSGYTVNGTFAEYALGQADYLGRIPDQLSFTDAAPILCAGVTTYKGLKQTQARPGEWVVISGVGGLGHVAVQYAKAMGLHVAAIDIGPEKLALARKLGAEVTVDAKEEDVVQTIQKKIGGAHGVLVTAVSLLNGQTVRGSIVGTRKDLEEALQFAAEGKVKATIEEQPLASINDIFDRLKKGKVNGRIVPLRTRLRNGDIVELTGATTLRFRLMTN